MRAEGDFALIEPTFFSTSQVGIAAPEIGKPTPPVKDAKSIPDLKAMDVLISCQGGDYTNEIHPKLRAQGWKTAILSNMPDALGVHLYRRSDLFAQFDHITLSYEIRSAKPEPEIYRSCLANLGLQPGEAVFLDDKVPNIQAAKDAGIHAVLFNSRADFAGQAAAYGLPPMPIGD